MANSKRQLEYCEITAGDDNIKTSQPSTSDMATQIVEEQQIKQTLEYCSNPDGCLSLFEILKSFNAPISEEQAWALIYQSVRHYRDVLKDNFSSSKNFLLPNSPSNLSIHKDGSVHLNMKTLDHSRKATVSSQKKILVKLATIVYDALDFNMLQEDACAVSDEVNDILNHMTMDDGDDDEGIVKDSDDDDRFVNTKELDEVLEKCVQRVSPTNAKDHYRAVCRALVMESIELNIFIQKVFDGGAEALRIKADAQTSKQELEKLGFNDWARFWIQVIDELRRGVRLKKSDSSRIPVEYELTPYEILMEDIRSRRFNLRKVMVNGDIPPRVKRDAHAVILEFIRSRPPLKKATDRKLAPVKFSLTPREQLLDSIRKGRVLKPTQKLKVLPTQTDTIKKASEYQDACQQQQQSSRNRQRLIKVEIPLLEDNDIFTNPLTSSSSEQYQQPGCSNGISTSSFYQTETKANNENNQNNINTILRRTTYDLATQCESRRASMRRHTIVGCHSTSNIKKDCQSVPPSRPESRQSDVSTTSTNAVTTQVDMMPPSCSRANPVMNDTWSKNSLDEKEWKEKANTNDRLSLTLEEIVHIRSVMTKAELEGLPVGVNVKEDVEKKKICFLCLRTRFSMFGQWGVQCKLCSRTVCSKCYSKMRIPTEHFRNVPVVLLSPSLMNSPVSSQMPSPSHHGQHAMDENFPRSLMERLMRPESERKIRNTVGSAPSSPKCQRSASSTPGGGDNKQPECSTSGALLTTNNSASNANCVLGPKANTNNNSRNSLMSRSMEGPRSLPPQSPARPHSNNSTLDRKNRFFTLTSSSSSGQATQKDVLCGELMAVCNDCRGLVLEIIRSSRQTRSTARNKAIRNLTLDLSPVYK